MYIQLIHSGQCTVIRLWQCTVIRLYSKEDAEDDSLEIEDVDVAGRESKLILSSTSM